MTLAHGLEAKGLETLPTWRAFGREWRECLDAYDIGFFHMTDFALRKKQFSDWPVEKCGPRFRKLASIINRHMLYCVGAVVPEPLYDAVASIDRRATPYQVAPRECLSRVAQFARGSRINGRLEFMFESETKGNGELLDAYNIERTSGRNSAGQTSRERASRG